MFNRGRICKSPLIDGVDDEDILVWDDDASEWVSTDIADIVDIDITDSMEAGTAQGQVTFWNNALDKWVHTEVTEVFWDDVNKRMGMNDSTPQSRLDVKGTVMVTRLLAGGVQP